jgi:citrate lyase subunit beta / citryl-CoA lyase
MRSWLDVHGAGDSAMTGGSEADVFALDLGVARDPAVTGPWAARARRRLRERYGPPGGARELWARLEPADRQWRPVRHVVSTALTGIFATVESATEVAALGTVIAEAEEAAGVPVGRISVIPCLGTAAAVLQAAEIARAPRVARLQLTEGTLARQLRVELGEDGHELLWARSMVVLAGAAAGLAPPISSPCPDGVDPQCSGKALRRLGFGGRVCAVEAHVRAANNVFATP